VLKVRPAQAKDIEQVNVMVAAMSNESPRYSRYPVNPSKVRNLVTYFCDGPEGGGFVAEFNGEIVGMIAGMVVESRTHDYKFAADVGVYVTPEHRGSSAALRLIRMWEAWAFAQGADEVNLGISTDVNAEQTVHIYGRLGYKMSGRSMVKYKE
jgi:GNAT superfamily N-acetyltransferase